MRGLNAAWQPGLAAALLVAAIATAPTTAWSQNLLSSEPAGNRYPADSYYLGLDAYRSGDLDAAVNLFEAALDRGRIDGNGRWIDSIPSLAMLAECHWQLGSLVTARQYVDSAFEIAVRRQGWLGRVEWPSLTVAGGQRATPSNLWPEVARVRLLPLNDRVMYQSGSPLTEQQLARGGVIEEPNIRSFDAGEVLRGLALAAYRRRVILGPLSDQDQLAQSLLDATKYPAGLQQPIPRALIGAVRAAGYFSRGDFKRVVENAPTAMVTNSAHPLSPIVMLCLGAAAAESDQASGAVEGLIHSVHVSAALQQYEMIGPALQLAAGYATQPQAAVVASAAQTVSLGLQRQSRLAAVHVLIAGADAAITAGDLQSAAEMLNQVGSVIARRDVALPRLQCYALYVTARLTAAKGQSFGLGESTAVDQSWEQMTRFMFEHRFRNAKLVSMPSVYQWNLLQQALQSTLGEKSGAELLANYLHGPSLELWRRDPSDALAAQVMDRSGILASRVAAAGDEGDGEAFLVRADALLADRFHRQLPLAGRLLQIHALARCEDGVLDEPALQWRQQAPPEMVELRGAVLANRAIDSGLLAQWESKATALALSRTEIPDVMLPRLSDSMPTAGLPPRTGLLVFIQSSNQRLHAALAVAGKITVWTINGGNRLPGKIGRVLGGIGVGRTRGNRLPADHTWQQAAAELRQQLFPSEYSIDFRQLDRLVVVPDGPLWYLPLELLSVAEEDSALMGDRLVIEYAPTPGTALKSTGATAGSRAIGITAGTIFAPKDPELNAAMLQSVVDMIEQPVRIPEATDQPSGWLGAAMGHFVVAAPRTPPPDSPLMMAVSPHDQSAAAGTLAGWLRFPAVVPQSVVLIALRTPVDAGTMGSGRELFSTLAALKAAGAENILLSRWAVGGESTAILLRELLQELPPAGIRAAWQRAKLVLRQSELDPSAEPLLTKADRQRDGLTGDQPLFWSGYLISAGPPLNPAPGAEPGE